MKFNKFLFSTMAMAVVSLAIGFSAQAQPAPVANPTNPPASSDPFYTEAFNWLTSFNTNYTWAGTTLEYATGVKDVNGVSVANTMELQIDIGNFNVGIAGQLYGVGTPWNSVEGQVGYRVISHYDTALDVDLRAGYDNLTGAAIIEPGIFLKKKLGTNWFAEIGTSVPWESKGKFIDQPTYYVEAGFTY